ncbi:protein geranylgeranyltransferase type I, beta subunit [Rhizoctonia solani AG-1 IB]|uniref:Protein geranylgeranyltransferase type I, beta subunit n=1 Tax=Thanatephorus cucumeris (strain AG1-IB / isolate 7/3/14) TaxID=1108050 RepID=A0A0B7G2L0_THACB|nr:protein geranylgeranyltransferase type I, beta subunit [Rhizoctonia solani AG-1 IB]
MSLGPLKRNMHTALNYRCLGGLGSGAVEADDSRMAVVFYSLAALDLCGVSGSKLTEKDRAEWLQWIWAQYTHAPGGAGFRGGDSLVLPKPNPEAPTQASPSLIMTYAAVLSLAILRDDFSQLDKPALLRFVASCQNTDGSFSALSHDTVGDLRVVYTAFVICYLLDDWTSIDAPAAISFIDRCRSYEGGYGQSPAGEAHGGTTYCALASLYLCPLVDGTGLTGKAKKTTIRWLSHHQTTGFCGRTGKTPDSCYSFWCGASLKILEASECVDAEANAQFISQCQFQFGGIAKVPKERPDPLHSYLSIASLALYPPAGGDDSWRLRPLIAALNAEESTAEWLITHLRK